MLYFVRRLISFVGREKKSIFNHVHCALLFPLRDRVHVCVCVFIYPFVSETIETVRQSMCGVTSFSLSLSPQILSWDRKRFILFPLELFEISSMCACVCVYEWLKEFNSKLWWQWWILVLLIDDIDSLWMDINVYIRCSGMLIVLIYFNIRIYPLLEE